MKKGQYEVIGIVLIIMILVVGVFYYYVSKSDVVKCINDSDCLSIRCVTTPCPQNKCINGKCELVVVEVNKSEFCGSSTLASCNVPADCKVGGCSGQVCLGKNEESMITTCEYRDCYNSEKFNLNCGCVGGKCEWG